MRSVRLKPGREKSVLRRHPWVFSGAVDNFDSGIRAGDTVKLISSKGDFLAWAAYSPQSQIRLRIWSWDADEIINADFFYNLLDKAVKARQELVSLQDTDAIRLVYAESDGLPGLIVDRYKDTLVIQALSWGAEIWRDLIVDILKELTDISNIYERSDVDVRNLEGLSGRTGNLIGDEHPGLTIIVEHGVRYQIDIRKGHKTGFYLDQRANRKILRKLSMNRQVLDCFSYTGGFTLNALVGGAEYVVAVDSSKESLEHLEENLLLNDLDTNKVDCIQADVFQVLRDFRDRGSHFDLIVLDPPKFAPTASQAKRAARGYKDINLLALKLLNHGGLLMTYSCSGGVDMDLFQKIVAGAALDADVNAQIIGRCFQDADHPIALNFPESSYLKGLIIRIT